jgi:hypothetical protein
MHVFSSLHNKGQRAGKRGRMLLGRQGRNIEFVFVSILNKYIIIKSAFDYYKILFSVLERLNQSGHF